MSNIQPFPASDIWAEPELERTTETQVFNFAPAFGGKDIAITIYTDGMADAERWSTLTAALLYGQQQQMLATIQKKDYEEKHILPNGKKLVVKDPSYIGSVRVLMVVLKSLGYLPKDYTEEDVEAAGKAEDNALGWKELLTFGHKAGKAFHDVLDWAATVNGVTADAVSKMNDLLKNARSLDQSESE